MRLMQKELEDIKELRQREARTAQEDREELAIFRDRCNKLEEENENRQGMINVSGPFFYASNVLTNHSTFQSRVILKWLNNSEAIWRHYLWKLMSLRTETKNL